MKVAYILDAFPVLSETFIVREILELRANNFEVPVFALGDTRYSQGNRVIHPDSGMLSREVQYPQAVRNRFSKLRQAILHLLLFFRNPKSYIYLLVKCRKCSRRSFNLFRRSVLYARIFEQEQVEHIHAHFLLHSCTLAMLVSGLTDIPFSFTVHAHDIFIPELADLMEEKIQRADFIVCISKYNKDYLLRKYPQIDETKIKIIHCGIDTERFCRKTKQKNDVFRILSIGRLHEQKGFKYLIKACEVLKKERGLDFVCDVAGDGKERREIEEIICRADLKKEVRMLGAMDQNSVRKAFESADVFVLPSVVAKSGAMDGIPVVLMEAMSMEIPVISTRISGIPELVKNGAGILVEPEDFTELADAIEKLAALSEEERRELGKRGRAIIERHFALKKEVKKLGELFMN